MKALSRTIILTVAFLCAAVALAQQSANKLTGSISGLVTIGGKPAPGIVVVLNPVEPGGIPRPTILGRDQKSFAKSTTDEEGRFTINGLAAGTYYIATASPVFISASDALDWRRGKQINLAEGETIDDVTIPLVRGGVITGRVTDSDGRPLTGERVTLHQLDEKGQTRPVYLPNIMTLEIDDRGIYRAYGLPPGRYRVSVGVDTRGNSMEPVFGLALYERTFHPDATDESRAIVIEILPGSESTGVDIKMGKPVKQLAVSGRVVYADSGQPVEGAMCGYGIMMPDGKNVSSLMYGSTSDKNGAFQFLRVPPGKYVITSMIRGGSDYYAEPVPFEVTGEDISGLEIKLYRGASISGVVVVEGTNDPEVLAKIPKLQVWVFSKEGGRGLSTTSNIAPDGSFRAGGIKSGRVSLSVNSYPPQKGLQLMRIERDGVEQPEGIEITDGAQISGVRLVMAYGTARIRGLVKFESGRMPEGQRVMISTRRLGSSAPQYGPSVEVDQRGRFELVGLVAGEYELNVFSVNPGSSQQGKRTKQIVTLADNDDIEVTINIDAKANDKERDQ